MATTLSRLDILQKPICYVTFEVKEKLLRCARCRCAWYSSKEDQRAHWHTHKSVCKEPDWDMVSSLSGDQCYKILNRMFSSQLLDHNTAALLERMYVFIRAETRRSGDEAPFGSGPDVYDMGFGLHSFTRISSFQPLDEYYKRAWAIPGMPQFLHFTDLKSFAYSKVVDKFPGGRPCLESEGKDEEFDEEYEVEEDDSGEVLGWFVIGFLIRSCVDGRIAMTSNHDGRGVLRYHKLCEAARLRVAVIFSTPALRGSAMKAMYPIPGFMLNIAETMPQEFIKLLNVGAFSGIIEWADQEYSLDLLELVSSVDPKQLNDDAKFQMLELCCNAFCYFPGPPWYSTGDPSEKKIFDMCIKIAGNILVNSVTDAKTLLKTAMSGRRELVTPQWRHRMVQFGSQRMVLAFLNKKISHTEDAVSMKSLQGWLNEWRKVKENGYPEFAEQVMEPDVYLKWLERTAETREYFDENKKTGCGGAAPEVDVVASFSTGA